MNGEICDDLYWTVSNKDVASISATPYASVQSNISSIARSAVTTDDIVGTWEDETKTKTYIFNSDNTGSYNLSTYGTAGTAKFNWEFDTFLPNKVVLTFTSGTGSLSILEGTQYSGMVSEDTMMGDVGALTKKSNSTSGGGNSGGGSSGGGNSGGGDSGTGDGDRFAEGGFCVVSGISAGKVKITAQTKDYKYSATCTVTVTEKGVAATGLALDKTSVELEYGEKIVLRPKFTPANATDQSVVWTSSDENIATVDEHGVVTGVALEEASATITAKSPTYGYTATCEIKVKAGETKYLGDWNADEILGEGWRDKTYIEIPKGITKIDGRTFSECKSLETVIIPNTVKIIGAGAFRYCTSLTNVIIPPSVKKIEDWAFENCHSLTSITLPEGITKINLATFYECENLTRVKIPAGVTSIGQSAFEKCSSLASITIPDSVTLIERWAFQYCNSLANITLPKNLKTIGRSAFSGCNLTSVTFSDTKGWESNSWDGKNYVDGETIDVRDASINAKKLSSSDYYDDNNKKWIEGWPGKYLFKGGIPSPDPFDHSNGY